MSPSKSTNLGLTSTIVVSGTVGDQLMVPILSGARLLTAVTENVRVALKAPSLAVKVIVDDPNAIPVMSTVAPVRLTATLVV